MYLRQAGSTVHMEGLARVCSGFSNSLETLVLQTLQGHEVCAGIADPAGAWGLRWVLQTLQGRGV